MSAPCVQSAAAAAASPPPPAPAPGAGAGASLRSIAPPPRAHAGAAGGVPPCIPASAPGKPSAAAAAAAPVPGAGGYALAAPLFRVGASPRRPAAAGTAAPFRPAASTCFLTFAAAYARVSPRLEERSSVRAARRCPPIRIDLEAIPQVLQADTEEISHSRSHRHRERADLRRDFRDNSLQSCSCHAGVLKRMLLGAGQLPPRPVLAARVALHAAGEGQGTISSQLSRGNVNAQRRQQTLSKEGI